MTHDDIIRMAKEAGFEADGFGIGIWDSADFNRFAALVAAAEREACAKVCDGWAEFGGISAEGCAKEIRARGEK